MLYDMVTGFTAARREASTVEGRKTHDRGW